VVASDAFWQGDKVDAGMNTQLFQINTVMKKSGNIRRKAAVPY
jgi:hypothetical protein